MGILKEESIGVYLSIDLHEMQMHRVADTEGVWDQVNEDTTMTPRISYQIQSRHLGRIGSCVSPLSKGERRVLRRKLDKDRSRYLDLIAIYGTDL